MQLEELNEPILPETQPVWIPGLCRNADSHNPVHPYYITNPTFYVNHWYLITLLCTMTYDCHLMLLSCHGEESTFSLLAAEADSLCVRILRRLDFFIACASIMQKE